MKQRILFFIFFISQIDTYSQNFQFLQYRVEDGLSTDIIKSVEEDAHGFIWIGSDAGLLQFNGNKFIHYPNASKSAYIKDLIKLHDDRLLALSDLGLVEIINLVDTVIFKNVLDGGRTPTDSSLWYPKSIFEDSNNNLWIGEPQSVVKFNGQTMERYQFEPEFSTSSFVRSFSFVELVDGTILCSSNNGEFFRLDPIKNEFTHLLKTGTSGETNHMLLWNGSVFLASGNGFFKVTSITEQQIEVEQLKSGLKTSHILALNDKEILISTFFGESFIYNLDGTSFNIPYKIDIVNEATTSSEGVIWLSSEKGLIMLKPQVFKRISEESDNIHIEAMAQKATKKSIFYSSKEHISTYELGEKSPSIIDEKLGGYFLSMQLQGDSLFTSNMSSVEVRNFNGKVVNSWDFSADGRFIFDMTLAKDGSLWFTQESAVGLKRIDTNGKVAYFNQSSGLNEELTVVKTNHSGVFVGSNNSNSYLYYKSYEDSVFQNISNPIEFQYQGDIRIEDIAFDNDTIWLATASGLLKHSKNKVEKLKLDARFDDLLVRTVKHVEGSSFLWFSNAYGLIQYNLQTKEYNIYDETHGLPSNSISARGLIIDDRIWLGTASGVAVSEYNFNNLEQTPKPFVVEFYADDQSYKPSNYDEIQLPSNPYVEIVISAPAYPSNKIRYQYKIKGADSQWIDLPSGNLITFSKLQSGPYNIMFRGKKYGNFKWSELNTFKFLVKKTFYETVWFKVVIALLAVLLIIATRILTATILKQRQKALEFLVRERTAELDIANKNLLERNQELDQFVYSTSHDLVAPLKSMKGLIYIAEHEEDEEAKKSLLGKMNTSVLKLEKFIKDVISYSRNTRLEIIKEPVELHLVVDEILENISSLPGFNKINIEVSIAKDCIIHSDETRIKIILNNLISNAVKFQKNEEENTPWIKISYEFEEGNHVITVVDNGQGISDEYKDHIFKMFYRANLQSDGSGLGLYILQSTVNKLNGKISLDSKIGVGSEFKVSFP